MNSLADKITAAADAKVAEVGDFAKWPDALAEEWYRHIQHARDVLARHCQSVGYGEIDDPANSYCDPCQVYAPCPELVSLAAAWGIT